MRFITGLLWFAISFLFASPQCVLFLYKREPLSDYLLQAYDWVVLPPENETPESLEERRFYLKKHAKLLAYLPVGELRKEEGELFKELHIGKVERWGSKAVDFRSPAYREWLLKRARELVKRGFDGFFLDTLDTYRAFAPKEEWESYEKALEELIRELRRRFPEKLLVLNRGFEVLPKVEELVDAVVVESLFMGLEGPVKEEDRAWLLERLKGLKVPVIVVDYVPPEEQELRREVAEKIRSLGFIPYVADGSLSEPGYSCPLLPRRVLLVYEDDLPLYSVANRLYQLPLEYLGFIPELVRPEELKPVTREGGYAAAVAVNLSEKGKEFEEWVLKTVKRGVKVFFAGSVPLSEETLKKLGVEADGLLEEKPEKVESALPYYEAPYAPPPKMRLLKPLKGKALLKVKVKGEEYAPLALTPWGGYAQSGALVNEEGLWVLNPFLVLKEALKPPPLAPDFTTENGRRLLTVHVDGDGFTQLSEVKRGAYASEVIRDEVIKAFPVPHTVSVIEGEIAPWGVHPDEAPKLEEIARSIFSLSFVEPASHSFSHPFTWNPEDPHAQYLPYGYNLPIKGYKLDYRREIEGSLKYLEERLLDEKRPRVFQWTGYCNPVRWQVRLTYKLGVFNANGGDTSATFEKPFLKFVSPSGVNYGLYFHVYAPVQNENVYTNQWTYPLWGYQKVIQTFKLTEEPYRLKPVSIYYHFYSGQKLAPLKALKKVYRWALSQEVIPLYLSHYVASVLDFRGVALRKEGDAYRVLGSGHLRTLRVPSQLGFPDPLKSKGLVGFRKVKDYYYLHLDGSGDYLIYFSSQKPYFYLVSSNGRVEYFKKEGNKLLLKLKAFVPLEAELGGRCKVFLKGKEVKGKLKLKEKEALLEALCPY